MTIESAMHKLGWPHILATAAITIVLVRVFTPGRTSAPLGDEDLQLRVRATGVPSDYAHYAEADWTGRRHPWPGAIGEELGALIYTGPCDYSNTDR